MIRMRVLGDKGVSAKGGGGRDADTQRQNLAQGVKKNATYDEAKSQVPANQPTAADNKNRLCLTCRRKAKLNPETSECLRPESCVSEGRGSASD